MLACGKASTTHEQLEIGISNALRTLPRQLIDQAEYISLSTTLATNACVENKGGRVALIFIGVKRETVVETYKSYGFDGLDFMYFFDGNVSRQETPDWDEIKKSLPEIVESYDGIAITQLFAGMNNGEFEKKLREMIHEITDKPVVCAYEIFKDYNAIKRGAGALLNARLIPVIDEFFQAVKNVLKEDNINLPFHIMRSDGSLVSEEYSKKYPVETLLCGPTASAKGSMELFNSENAIVIDMGGTTSDIALIKNGEIVIDTDGVKVGKWQTFVRGIAIDTFGLGGDTHVTYNNSEVLLGDRRVVPISMLVDRYSECLQVLKELSSLRYGSPKALYEHFILMRPIDDILKMKDNYTEQELAICKALAPRPLSLVKLTDAVGSDPYVIKLSRLEDEGIIIRCGFTPTDAMVIRGDFVISDEAKAAATLASDFITRSIEQQDNDKFNLSGEVYNLVEERLYHNIVRILWKDFKQKELKDDELALLKEMSTSSFRQELRRQPKDILFTNNIFSTDATLLGVGAPTHVFLPEVARVMHTDYMISEYSGVSNALGALLGDVCVYESIKIQVEYSPLTNPALSFPEGQYPAGEVYILEGTGEFYEDYDAAIQRASVLAEEAAKAKALECGASDIYDVTSQLKEKNASVYESSTMFMGATVTACAKGKL